MAVVNIPDEKLKINKLGPNFAYHSSERRTLVVALDSLILKLVSLWTLCKCTADMVYFNSLSASAVVTSYCNLILQAALDWMSKGHMLADAVAIIGKHM